MPVFVSISILHLQGDPAFLPMLHAGDLPRVLFQNGTHPVHIHPKGHLRPMTQQA
jgi:hypothetical protein